MVAMKRQVGTYVTTSTAGEQVRAFVPNPLPPDPELQLTPDDLDLIERANRALGKLDGLATLLPEASLFLYMYVRKEAVLSSQIEGTQSSFADLLLYEHEQSPGVPLGDVEEVSSYVAAMKHGLDRLRGGFPLSLRLIREIHGVLLAHGRGSDKEPGEFRRSQNWIGGTRPGNARFVPPPPDRLPACLSDLERFLHGEPVRMPALLRAAMAHVQFETIHPFLDGNGRLGRLLVALLLCQEGALSEPVLYLSLFFKQHRDAYYDQLQRVRTLGDWEGWIRFFMEGVATTADEGVAAARSILDLFAEHRRSIGGLGRASGTGLRVHELLQRKPVVSIADVASALDVSAPTAASALKRLQEIGIAREITGRQRDRLFVYEPYVRLLGHGTEPIG